MELSLFSLALFPHLCLCLSGAGEGEELSRVEKEGEDNAAQGRAVPVLY